MAPVKKKILKTPEIKNNFFFETQKPAATPTFCKRNFFQMYQKTNLNFFSFSLRLGNQHFGSKQHVNQTIFEKKVCIAYSNDSRQLLMPKQTLDYYQFFSRKLV